MKFCCSVANSCPTLCDPMNCSTPGFPVPHYLQKFAETHVYSDNDEVLVCCIMSYRLSLNHWVAESYYIMELQKFVVLWSYRNL